MRQTLGSYTGLQRGFQLPAGALASRQSSTTGNAHAAGQPLAQSGKYALPGAAGQVYSTAGGALSSVGAYSSSSGGVVQGTRGLQSAGKLASLVVASVDDEYNARADPNMPDGSFNPGLTLQQSAGFEAVRQARELERRINRGLVSLV